MQNRLTTMVLMLIYLSTNAQDVSTFNKTYQNDTTNRLAVCVLPTSNDSYIFCGGLNAPNNYTCLYAQKINKKGETVFLKPLKESDTVYNITTLFGSMLLKTNDNNYVVLGAIQEDEYECDFFLVKFDEEGNVIWEQNYTTSDTLDAPMCFLQTTDKGFLLVGHSSYFIDYNNGDPSHFLLIKTDSMGQVQWKKQSPTDTYAIPFHAEQTTDGGYIISGYNYHDETGYDMYAVKTDSLGNVQWEQNYGTEEDDGACLVLEVENGSYALLGIVDKTEEFQPLWYTQTQLYFVRLDSLGNEILNSRRYYANQSYYGPETAYFNKSKNEIVAITTSYSPNPTQPYLDKFSLSGERLLHVPLSTGIGMEDYLRDVEPTPDGGYVLAGFNYTTPQSSWVVKVDSLGNSCGVADCDNYVEPVGISETPLNDQLFKVLPNPAQDYLVVENHNLEQNATFVLYDVTGRQVLSFIPENQSVVPIEHLPSGVYLYHILNPKKQMLIYGKVSIVR